MSVPAYPPSPLTRQLEQVVLVEVCTRELVELFKVLGKQLLDMLLEEEVEVRVLQVQMVG